MSQTHCFTSEFRGIHFTEWVSEPLNLFERHNPYLLVLHGWMGGNADMASLARATAAEGYHVIVPDLPYHQRSLHNQPKTISEAAEALFSALFYLIRPAFHADIPFAVVGYSFGGRLALELCSLLTRRAETRITLRAVVLISCSPAAETASEHATCSVASHCQARQVMGLSCSPDFEIWLRNVWYQKAMWGSLPSATVFESLIASRVQAFSVSQRDAWAAAAVNLDRTSMTSFHLSNTQTIPTLYMCGAEDTKYVDMKLRLQSIFPDFQSVIVPRSGHNVLLQTSDIAVPKITSFITGHCKPTIEKVDFVLDRVSIMNYSLPLVRPMTVKGRNVLSREGFLVGVATTTGVHGVGDVCPLPGLHSLSVPSCYAEVDRFAHGLKNEESIPCARCFDMQCLDSMTDGLSSVVCNGIACAIIQALSKTLGKGMTSCLRNLLTEYLFVKVEGDVYCNQVIQISGVLPRKPEDGLTQSLSSNITDLSRSPFQTMKLKVGASRDVRDDAQLVIAAIQACEQLSKTLRLDANRAWNASEYEIFTRLLHGRCDTVEYVEEPLLNISLLKDTLSSLKNSQASSYKLRIALDETLDDCAHDMGVIADLAKDCTALILKPAVIGSLQRVAKLIQIATDTECALVVSSVFESGVGIAWDAILASVCNNLIPSTSHFRKSPCHGLGTFTHLRGDVIDPPFASMCVQQNGSIIDIQQCEQYLSHVTQTFLKEKPRLSLPLQ